MATFQVSEEEQFVPREIVRAFSMRIKTEYENDTDSETELRRALRENVEEEESQQKKRIREINEYLNSTRPHELAKLNQLRNALELSMQEFAARVQRGQSQDVLPRKFESWEDVTSIVESLMGRLKHKQETGKFRRATKHLRTFCNTIKAHSTALKMLPTNNDYVKVFYGALATVLQASEGYTKVMEALPRALVEINDAVAGIEKRSWLFENTTMKSYMWRIYSQIFSFLGEVIRWYTKRSIQRAISSFNEHLEEFFEDQVEEIRKLAKLVHDEADFRAQADAQINRLYLEEMDGKFDRFINELRERDAAQRSILNRRYDRFHEALETKQRNELFDPQVLGNKLLDLCNRLRQQDTGSAVRDILEEDARKQLPWSGDMANPYRAQNDDMLVLSQGFVSRTVTQSDGGIPPAPKATRDAILLNSAQLEDYFDRAQLVIPGSSENNATFAEPDVADRIRSWIVATDSQILYTSGTDPFGEHLQNSSTVGQYATAIREAGLPMCSYSCLLKNEIPPPGRTQETIELVALVYSLIRQLIEILPPMIEPGSALIQNFRWDELDGSLRTFPLAFEILEVLLNSTKHAVVIIIIDAIDLLEDPSHKSTEKWLTRLVQLFVKLSKTSQSTVFKIWFNSGGMSQTLFQILEPHQIALSSSSKKPGRQTFGSEFIIF